MTEHARRCTNTKYIRWERKILKPGDWGWHFTSVEILQEGTLEIPVRLYAIAQLKTIWTGPWKKIIFSCGIALMNMLL